MNAPSPSAWSERCRLLAPQIVDACAAVPASAGAVALSRDIRRRLPEWSFRETFCRGGWYRLGGIVSISGGRVADQLEQWATDSLAAHDGDLASLAAAYAESGLRATLISGRSHYFVAAASGTDSADFLQLEVEELQEIYGASLFERAQPPATLDELVDAQCPGASCPACEQAPLQRCGTPLGAPKFRFRRLTHIGDLLARMRSQSLEAQAIHRFFGDWDASSASRASTLCNHWSISLREHVDHYRQTITRAVPIAAVMGEAPAFPLREETQGLSLGQALNAYDRSIGYPMAWFFAMVASRTVPRWVAAAVVADAKDAFAYLPECDLAVVRQWLHKPYAF